MDPSQSFFSDEPMSSDGLSTKNAATSSLVPSKSKVPWMALGDLVDDQLRPIVIRIEKSTIDPNIEKTYGPFEDTPLWAYPSVAATPKLPHRANRNNHQRMANSKEDLTTEITRLKALIAERQRNNIKQRMEQRTPPLTQQSSPVKKQLDPSSPILPTSPIAPQTSTTPQVSGNDGDSGMTVGVDEHKSKMELESSLDPLQRSQASNTSDIPLVTAPTSTASPPKAANATSTLRLKPTSDIKPIQETSQTPIATGRKGMIDLAQDTKEAKADDLDQLLGPIPSTESTQQAEYMDSMVPKEANVSIVNGCTVGKAGHGLENSIDQNTSASGQTSKIDADIQLSGNNSSNKSEGGITLSDIDLEMDVEEDRERAKLRSEEQKHKNQLRKIRQLQTEMGDQLHDLDSEKQKFENYIRRIGLQRRQKHHVLDILDQPNEASINRKKPYYTTTEPSSTSAKRQKLNDSRMIPQPRPSVHHQFINTVPRQLPTFETTRVTAPNKSSSSNTTSTKNPLYNESTDDVQKNEIKPLPGGMDVADYFKEFADLVRNRAIFDSEVERLSSTATNHDGGIRSHRKTPRTEKLITLHSLTFSCGPFRLMDDRKKRMLDTEPHRPLRYSESLILAMMVDGIPRIPSIPPPLRQSLRGILDVAPRDFRNFLLHYRHGQIFPGLDLMLDTNLAAIVTHGNLELLWATYTELMIYRYGYSDELASSVLNAQQYHPFSLDLYWHTVLAAPVYSTRRALITEILRSLSTSRSSPNFNGDSANVSGKSTDILFRTLKYNGIHGILDQLLPTTDVNLSDAGRLLKISLSSTPSYIYINDHDLCYLWMSVVVYYVYGQLQEDPNRYWYDRICVSGELAPNTNINFLIDWTKIRPHLLNDEEQTVVVTMLLEMLSYFCEKARSNGAKKSLLVAVWRNLAGCLEILKCYGPPGTLMLLKRNMQTTWKIKALQPEMADMTYELERKITNHQQIDIDPLCNKVLKSTGGPMVQLPAELFLAYRSALGLEPKSSDGDWKLLTVAWRLGRPLWQIYNSTTLSKLDNMKAILVNGLDEPPRDLTLVQINYLCGLYSSALGVADSFEMLQVSKFKISTFRKMPVAWINALMVHVIHFWLTRDSFLVQSFLKEIPSPDTWYKVAGKDGCFLLMRFKKDCEKLIKN